jgi:hypothetical protein
MLLGFSLMIAIFSQSVCAEGGKYQVELLVFSQSLPTTEVFDQTESKIQWPTALTELSTLQQTDNKALKGYCRIIKEWRHSSKFIVGKKYPSRQQVS